MMRSLLIAFSLAFGLGAAAIAQDRSKDDLPPAAAVEVPALSTAWSGPTPVAGSLSGGAPAGRGLPVPAPVLLGVALVGLALLLRRRRRG